MLARFSEANHKRRTWFYVAPQGVQPADVLEPAFWLPIATQVGSFDHIEVTDDSMSWWCELFITSVDHHGVHVRPMRSTELQGMGPRGASPKAAGAHLSYCGPFKKWCALDADGETLKEGFETEALAGAWLSQYVKTVNQPGAA